MAVALIAFGAYFAKREADRQHVGGDGVEKVERDRPEESDFLSRALGGDGEVAKLEMLTPGTSQDSGIR